MTTPAAFPDNEVRRLARLRALCVLDTGPEAIFDALVRAAADVCGVEISALSLIDADRQWFKASVGLLGLTETSRDLSFCGPAIISGEVLEIPDLLQDERFADHPMVTGAPNVRYYAGAPIELADGLRLGSLCVVDRVPRKLGKEQLATLRNLATAAAEALEFRGKALQSVAALQASQSHLERLYRSTPAMLHSVDANGLLLTVSDTWLSEMGYSREEVLGKPTLDFLTPASRILGLSVLGSELLATGRCEEIELEMTRKDGSVFDTRFSAVVEYDENRQMQGVVTVAGNITKRKRAERALLEERSRLQAILEGTDAGTWEWNVQSGEVRVNERLAAMIGYTLEELSPFDVNTFLHHIHPDDLSRWSEQSEVHLRGESDRYESEIRLRHKNGEWVWLLGRGRVSVRTDDGRPLWMFGTHLDISESKRAQQAVEDAHLALAEATRRFHTATVAAGVGLWSLDVVSGVVEWDDTMFALYGIKGQKVAVNSECWLSKIHSDDVEFCKRQFDMALRGEGEKDFDCNFRVIWPDGSIHHIHAKATMECDAAGNVLRALGTHWDITEQRQAEQALRSSELFLERTGEIAGVGGWRVDLPSGEITWSDHTCRLHDLPVGNKPSLQEAISYFTPESRQVVEQETQKATETGKPWTLELSMVSAKGRPFWARLAGAVDFEGGRPARLIGAFQDVTQRRELERKLAEGNELLQVTLDSIGDAVITTDARGQAQWMNPVAERLTGWLKADARGRRVTEIFTILNEETREPVEDPVSVCLAQREVMGRANHRLLISRDGTEYGITDSAAPIRDPQGQVLGVVLVFHDVSEQRRMSNEMSYRAKHDALTGLINRREFEERLSQTLARAREDASANALMYIDLDQFKVVNDACGHSIGDQLLKQVGALLQGCVRARDMVARLGGDEFGVILENCDIDQAQRAAQKICDQMEEFRFQHDGRRFRVGSSIGLVPVDGRWPTAAAVLQAADTSCYAAKEAGRNRVHAWYDTDHAMNVRHGEMRWVSRLEQALDEDRFELYAQRVVPIAGVAENLHFEVLLRLREADGSISTPGAFLLAAERFHMATRLDRWVLRRVLDWLSRPDSEVARIGMIAINLSGQSIGDRAFHRHVIDIVGRANFDVGKLCFEITETSAITNLVDARAFIDDVRRLGVKIALDDFGAGASSFSYLKTMPVDFIKIDGQFITDLLDDALDNAAVRCFRDVASILGVRTIAEFVEREDVLLALGEIGIDMAQGHLIHRAEPLADMMRKVVSGEYGTEAANPSPLRMIG